MPPPSDSRLWLVGSTVRSIRQAHGISAGSFARDVGISPAHLSSIERQRRQVSPAVLVALAARLGVSVDALTVNLDEVPQMAAAVEAAAQ